MMKNYFEYNSQISSIELAQAIASPIAPGPFAGFSYAEIIKESGKGTILRVHSKPDRTMEGQCNYLESIDNIVRRNISKLNTGSGVSSSYINFGCIARDGSIHTSDQEIIDVTIQGEKGSLNEVLLFAKHTPVTEKIENPITFIAEWNNSAADNSLYKLYKSSVNPQLGSDILNQDPSKDSTLSYDHLNNKLKEVSSTYADEESSLVFIGAYGTGVNDLGNVEDFALVPYFGKFPVELSYNTYIHNILFNSISALQRATQTVKRTLGMVELWAGREVPANYHLCDGSELNAKEYPDLHDAIGDVFNNASNSNGGKYTTSKGYFRLPDLRGRFIVGYHDSDEDYNSIGNASGEKTHLLTEAEMPAHSHTHDHIHEHRHQHTYNMFLGNQGESKLYSGDYTFDNTNRQTSDPTTPYTGGPIYEDSKLSNTDTSETGGGQAHENRPPYYVLAYIMRVKLY
jgi:microcystin-dependent protein